MSMPSTVLIVEDDPDTVRLVGLYLGRDGHKVLSAADGIEGLRLAREERPDLVVLDLMLPRLNGMEVCRVLRDESEVPIVMLTARVEEAERVVGLELGADDYVTKPFSPRELAARVRAVLRRVQRPEELVTAALTCGELEVDFARHTVSMRGERVALTPTEYALLRQLALNADRVVLHEDLLAEVWGPEYRNDIDYLRAYVRYLRRKLERDPANPQVILTSPGIGYMLSCPDEETDQ